jgi:hypothetical protein
MSYAMAVPFPTFLDEAEEVRVSGYRQRWEPRFQELVEAVATQPDADRPWAAARRTCLNQYGHRCAVCGRPAQAVHHIFPRWWFFEGSNSQMNLAAVCADCHPSLEWHRPRFTSALALLRLKGRAAQRPWSREQPRRSGAAEPRSEAHGAAPGRTRRRRADAGASGFPLGRRAAARAAPPSLQRGPQYLNEEVGMAAFMGEIKTADTKRKALKDKDGNVTGYETFVHVVIHTNGADNEALADALASMFGKDVKVSVTPEQTDLPFGR